MSSDIRNKTILQAAEIAVFAVMFCVGCYDLGIEPSVPTPTIETFVDIRDGKTYRKVQIGTQTWMAENLKYEADNSICYYDGWSHVDPVQNCREYGRLYDWNTAMNGESGSNTKPSGVEGVCPVGWHLPSDAEWTVLIDYVGKNAGTKLKSREFHGNSETRTPDGTDIYGFSALSIGRYSGIDRWWTASDLESDNEMAWVRGIANSSVGVAHGLAEKHGNFLSVRCVHD